MNFRSILQGLEPNKFGDLLKPYATMYYPELLLPYFSRLAEKRDIATDADGFFWLHYICLLLGVGDVDSAKRLLTKYINGICGVGGVMHFPTVSALATEIGVDDEDVKHTAELLTWLEEADRKCLFENLIKGKRVAVVGNSPSEIGRGVGAEIDGHDLVIRFNNYMLDGYEKDYGTRTDIWIRGFGFAEVEDRTDTNVFKYAGISGDYHYIPFCTVEQARIAYRDVVVRKRLCSYFDPLGFRRMHRSYFGEPTTGLATIYSCLRYGAGCIDCYGFSFREKHMSMQHYFGKHEESETAAALVTVHNLPDECVYLKRLTRDLRWTKKGVPHFVRIFDGPGSIWQRFNPKFSCSSLLRRVYAAIR